MEENSKEEKNQEIKNAESIEKIEENADNGESVISEDNAENGKTEEDEKIVKRSRRPSKSAVKGFIAGIAVTIAALVVAFVLYMKLPFGYSVESPESLSASKKVNEILNFIDENYNGDIDYELMSEYMCLGLVSGLEDQYSTYYTKEQYEALSNKQQGQYKGIGLGIVEEDGEIVVADVTEDGPSDKAGIQTEDVIKGVNDEKTEDHTISEVTQMIQDAKSDDIELEIYRPSTDETFNVTVTRQLIESVSVAGGMIDDTGYIAIQSFTGVTAEQFAAVLEQVKEEGAKRLIIDLRDNGGGLVSAACDTLREIVPDGVLVYTEDKNGNREESTSDSGNELDMPIAVLVNEDTASASEIFAGCLQDRGVAVIVGTQTYGKGIIQDVFELGDGSVIRLTVKHYYTPNGNDIHGVGITPDVDVEYDSDSETDTQLTAAIEALENSED